MKSAERGEHDLRGEWERGGRRPRRNRTVVRPVRRTARAVPEEPALHAVYDLRDRAGAMTGSESPAAVAIAGKAERVADGVSLLDECGAAGILEIIERRAELGTLVTHERVVDPTEIDPEVGEVVNEERAGVEQPMAVDAFPRIRRAPRRVGVGGNRVRR